MTRTNSIANDDSATPPRQKRQFFAIIERQPWAFAVFLPLVFVILIGLGLSRPDLIEGDVAKLWIPSDGNYAKNKKYAESVGATGSDKVTTFAAMAVSRHGENLFTEDNLNAVKERMQRVESIQVSYKGNNFTWDDICYVNGVSDETTYKFPCLRLSPMDLFQEANWYFTEEHRVAWYNEVKSTLIQPLMVRYGVMLDMCISPAESTACDHMYLLRTDPDYAIKNNFPQNQSTVTDLLKDIFNLEMNDPCRICIDNGIDEKMTYLKDDYVIPAFTMLTQQLRRLLFELEDREDARPSTLDYVTSLIRKSASIATSTTRADVEEFFTYKVIRDLYADMGATSYQEMYREVNDPLYRGMICNLDGIQCPPADVTLEEAKQALIRHADSPFSSLVTFGAPFPFWSAPDGTGNLFAGSYPVGGSGINMSAPFESLAEYLDLHNRDGEDWKPLFYDTRRQDGFVDPLGGDFQWETMVTKNPVYAWFMAGETEMRAHCGNGDLLGTNISDDTINTVTAQMIKGFSDHLCTEYNTPSEVDETRTKQHFAKMWYNLLIDSPFVLGITQGISDPYTWTLGTGCGFELGMSRFSYSGQSEETILQKASVELYNIDEGAEIGVIDRTPLIGDAFPPLGDYSLDNPLQHVGLLQNIYLVLSAKAIVRRVKHKNRPGGFLNITEEDARNVLSNFKTQLEYSWNKDDDDEGDVQFACFLNDAEVPGTIGSLISSIRDRIQLVTVVSVLITAIISGIFSARYAPIDSQLGLALCGALLAILAFYAAVALGRLIDIKMHLTTMWTLPFVIVFLGIDNMFIVLHSLGKHAKKSVRSFVHAMNKIMIPVIMTGLLNFGSMIAIMSISSIPAVNRSAQVALFAVVFVTVAMLFCFPAGWYLDFRRKVSNQCDVFCWSKGDEEEDDKSKEGDREEEEFRGKEDALLERVLYKSFYKRLILGESYVRIVSHSLVWALAALLLGLSLFGINSNNNIGMGLSDFLPSADPAHIWAVSRAEVLGAFSVHMNWPALNYGDPDTQMKMIQQFEHVAATPYIGEIDTRMLWIAEMALWTTRMCDYNMKLGDRKCGRDHSCSGGWRKNSFHLREQYFAGSDDVCQPHDGGVCRPTSKMHPDDLLGLGIDLSDPLIDQDETWCPVFEMSEEELKYCVRIWHEIVGGYGDLVLDDDVECEGEFCEDHLVSVPIPYSSGPPMTAKGMVEHALTLEMIEETRNVCNSHGQDVACWMAGPPFDYWSVYQDIGQGLIEIAGAMVLTSFVISFIFLATQLTLDRSHGAIKVFSGSLIGASLIAATCVFSLVAVVGLAMLADVSLTAFTTMTFALSIGFAIEYSVHIVMRWLRSDKATALDRVKETMEQVFLPTFMSFVSTTLGIVCLALANFEFCTRFFVKPLVIVTVVTYFFGCYWLPVFLTLLDFDVVKLGKSKMHDAEPVLSALSKMESTESLSDECGQRRDIEGNTATKKAHTSASCMENAIRSPSEPSSLNFLSCHEMPGCGGEQLYDDFCDQDDVDDNSLTMEQTKVINSPQSAENICQTESSLTERSRAKDERPQTALVDAASTTESVENTDTEETGTSSSNIAESSTGDLQDAVSAQNTPTVDVVAERSHSDPPAHIRTSPLNVEPNREAPKSTGGIFRTDTDQSATFFRELPIQRSLSSPRKKLNSMSPRHLQKSAVELKDKPSSDNAILNANAIYNANVQGYDFSTVLDEKSQEAMKAPPASNREVVRGERTGEVLSIHAACDGVEDKKLDIVKF